MLIYVCAVLLIVAVLSWYVNGLNLVFNPSGIVIALTLGFVLRYFSILPEKSVVYDYVNAYFIKVGICCFLFGSSIFSIMRSGRNILSVFFISAFTVVVASIVTNNLISIGENQKYIISMLNASYIGGTANMLFMSKYMGFNDPATMGVLCAADNIVMGIYLIIIGVLSKKLPVVEKILDTSSLYTKSMGYIGAACYSIGIVLLLNILFGSVASSYTKFYLWALTIVTILASTFVDHLNKYIMPAHNLGGFLFLIFFCVLGTEIDISNMSAALKELALCASLIIGIHFVLLLLIGKLFKIDFSNLIIASNACIGGTATVVPFAKSKNWTHLIETATIMSIMGYAVANFISVVLYSFVL